MTHKEIFEALLAGKKLTYTTSQLKAGERWITLVGYHLRDQDGRLIDGIVIGESCLRWQLYEEPNPHTPGTFAWAREEAKRGKGVTRKHFKEASGEVRCTARFTAEYFTNPNQTWALGNIDATDWEVVP